MKLFSVFTFQEKVFQSKNWNIKQEEKFTSSLNQIKKRLKEKMAGGEILGKKRQQF